MHKKTIDFQKQAPISITRVAPSRRRAEHDYFTPVSHFLHHKQWEKKQKQNSNKQNGLSRQTRIGQAIHIVLPQNHNPIPRQE